MERLGPGQDHHPVPRRALTRCPSPCCRGTCSPSAARACRAAVTPARRCTRCWPTLRPSNETSRARRAGLSGAGNGGSRSTGLAGRSMPAVVMSLTSSSCASRRETTRSCPGFRGRSTSSLPRSGRGPGLVCLPCDRTSFVGPAFYRLNDFILCSGPGTRLEALISSSSRPVRSLPSWSVAQIPGHRRCRAVPSSKSIVCAWVS